MKNKFLTSKDNEILINLKDSLSNFQQMDWVVAFGTLSGFRYIENEFVNFLDKGGFSRYVFDISQGLTDPNLIYKLNDQKGLSDVKIHIQDSEKEGFIHHKVYLFKTNNPSRSQSQSIIGSSNFTRSAFEINHESAVLTTDDSESAFFKKVHSWFENTIWNDPYSFDINISPNIINEYEKIYSKSKKLEKQKTTVNKKIINEIKDLIISEKTRLSKPNPDESYLLGLILGNNKTYQKELFNKRKIVINFRKSNNQNSYFQKFHFVADSAHQQHVARMMDELKSFIYRDNPSNTINLNDKSTNNTTIFQIEISFFENSNLWTEISNNISGLGFNGNLLINDIPISIKNGSDYIKLKFIQGITDLRARVSGGDSLPNGTQERIGIGFNTENIDFLKNVGQLLENNFSEKINIADGSSRGKDHMLRITPSNNTHTLFRNAFHKLISNEMAKINIK